MLTTILVQLKMICDVSKMVADGFIFFKSWQREFCLMALFSPRVLAGFPS